MDAQEIDKIFSHIDKIISEKNDSKQKEEALFNNLKTNLNKLKVENTIDESKSFETKMNPQKFNFNGGIFSKSDELKIDLANNEKVINTLNSDIKTYKTDLKNTKNELKFTLKEMERKNILLERKENSLEKSNNQLFTLKIQNHQNLENFNKISEKFTEKKNTIDEKNREIKILRDELEKRNIELYFKDDKIREISNGPSVLKIKNNEETKEIKKELNLNKEIVNQKHKEIKILRKEMEKKNILIESQKKNYENLQLKLNQLSSKIKHTMEDIDENLGFNISSANINDLDFKDDY